MLSPVYPPNKMFTRKSMLSPIVLSTCYLPTWPLFDVNHNKKLAFLKFKTLYFNIFCTTLAQLFNTPINKIKKKKKTTGFSRKNSSNFKLVPSFKHSLLCFLSLATIALAQITFFFPNSVRTKNTIFISSIIFITKILWQSQSQNKKK